MSKYHNVEFVSIENRVLKLKVDGKQIQKSLKEISPVLANANEEELNKYEITPSGYGIHWPTLDEDISIDGILGIVHKPEDYKRIA